MVVSNRITEGVSLVSSAMA